ncbi:MAG: hypothetical protein LBH22_07540 [Bacteroidales bacterium]|jgi:hypothetical protein|nr:hypothetical protein [Bacteroidales bacterium]
MENNKKKSDYSILTKVVENNMEKECVKDSEQYRTPFFVLGKHYKKYSKFISKYPKPTENI